MARDCHRGSASPRPWSLEATRPWLNSLYRIMKLIDPDHFELSTGRRFSANNGIIGLNADNDLTEGYDGGIYVGGNPWDEPNETWSAAEKAELADYMIARWQAFKATGERQYHVTLRLDEAEVPRWRERAAALRDVLTADLRQRGLVPKRAPDLPSAAIVPNAEIVGPFRTICQYVLYNPTELDADGEVIRNEPAHLLRVDTIVDA